MTKLVKYAKFIKVSRFNPVIDFYLLRLNCGKRSWRRRKKKKKEKCFIIYKVLNFGAKEVEEKNKK